MKLRYSFAIAFIGFGVASSAHAQTAMDFITRSGGNLRLDVNCADYWATPDTGLQLTVDGVPQSALGINDVDAVGYTRHGNPYLTSVPDDVGYAIAPGKHHLELSTPGCASASQDVDVWPLMPRTIAGRLAVSDTSLQGPVGAPNGFGITLGGYYLGRPAHAGSEPMFSTTYAYDAGSTDGGYLSASYEHRGLVAAWDFRFGVQSTSGTATGTGPDAPSGSVAFTGTEISFDNTLRVGARLPLQDVALEAGSGLGGELRGAFGGLISGSNLFAPGEEDLDWYIPLWVGATIKSSCNWGAQVLASYDVHPTSMGDSALAISAGLIWQPSDSCAIAPGLAVR